MAPCEGTATTFAFTAMVDSWKTAVTAIISDCVYGASPGRSESEPTEIVYKPDFPIHHSQAMRAGHGGGDFFTNHAFAEAIRSGEPPYLDVYRGIEMSIVGVLAWRSALNDSAPLDVPDFRIESVRRKYAEDDWSPDPARAGKGQPPCSILGNIDPGEEAQVLAGKVWGRQGYSGD